MADRGPEPGDTRRHWPAIGIRFDQGADRASLTEHLQFFLDDYFPTAIDDEGAGEADWLVYFASSAHRDIAARALTAARLTGVLEVSARDEPDEDWAARSQASLRAIRIDDLVVAPPWDTVPGAIVIQPSMGFGTGHHATTRLCLRAMQRLPLSGATVLDVGTGSGVLAIAAARLGAAAVWAVDNDPDAIASARENVGLNRAETMVHLSEVSLEELRSGKDMPVDLLVANLTWAPLVQHARALQTLTRAGGRLVLSGFTLDEEPRVMAAFADCAVEARWAEDEWVAATLATPAT